MTRREFGVSAAGVTIAAQTGGRAQAASTVDQNPIRRRRFGQRGIDPSRASAGLTLFAPLKSLWDGMGRRRSGAARFCSPIGAGEFYGNCVTPQQNIVFRVYRYTEEEIEKARIA